MTIRQKHSEEPSLFQVGDLVLVQNTRRRKGENPKRSPSLWGRMKGLPPLVMLLTN